MYRRNTTVMVAMTLWTSLFLKGDNAMLTILVGKSGSGKDYCDKTV